MHIDELIIQNFRCIKKIKLKFSPDNIAVIIGINGAGKSSVLDSIAILLIQLKTQIIKIELVELFESDAAKEEINRFLTLDDINYESKQANVSLIVSTDYHDVISWNATKSIVNKDIEGNYHQISRYIEYLRQNLESSPEFNLPLLVYYRTRRMSLDTQSINSGSSVLVMPNYQFRVPPTHAYAILTPLQAAIA